MNSPYPGHQPRHHLRFYVIMVTAVIIGIFFLLLANDSDFSLTSAMVGIINESTEPEVKLEDGKGNEAGEASDEKFSKNPRQAVGKDFKEVSFLLFYDQIPTVKQETVASEIILGFDDLSTNIDVNGDRLELNNLQQVVLQIKDFNGELGFDRQSFSLEGKAKGLAINNIALSSKGEIEISFDNLEYSFLTLDGVELTMLEMPRGNGEITLAEKLTYGLEQELVEMYYFNGMVIVDFEAESLVQMEGIARGVGVSGAILGFNMQ